MIGRALKTVSGRVAAAKPAASVGAARGFRADLIGTDETRQHQVDPFADERAQHYIEPQKKAIRVAVTGAAGNIGYSLLFRIASGEVFGPNQPVIINAVELPHAMQALKGVAMELEDSAFPLLQGVVQTDDLGRGFDDIDYAMLVGSKPRGPGMERGDLLKDNGAIFKSTGQALNKFAKKSARIAVVGNPANTNCLIASHHAPDIPQENFSALTRLDHDRGLAQIANKLLCPVTDIEQFVIWGNHSPTMYPDVSFTKVHGQPIQELVGSDDMASWLAKFEPRVGKRGAEIIDNRGASSAASAANGTINAVRDWHNGTNGRWVSAAVPSDGSYGIEEGLFFSYPVTYDSRGEYSIVQGLDVSSEYSQERINKTKAELFAERDAVADLLN